MEIEGVLSVANGGTGMIEQCTELVRIADTLDYLLIMVIVYVVAQVFDIVLWSKK